MCNFAISGFGYARRGCIGRLLRHGLCPHDNISKGAPVDFELRGYQNCYVSAPEGL